MIIPVASYNSVESRGLVMYYDFSDAACFKAGSNTIYDLSGNGYNGSLTGCTYNSLNGGTVLFADNQWVTVNGSTTAAFTPDNITLCCWARPTTAPGFYHTYFAKWGSANSYIMVGVGSCNWDINNEALNILAPVTNYYNTWNFFTTTYDRVLGKIYVNGRLANSGSYTAAFNSSTSQALTLGANTGAASGRTLIGYMGTAMVFNRALSDSEIYQIYNVQRGRFGV